MQAVGTMVYEADIQEHVQTLAQINGWKGDPLSADDEFYHEAFDEAEVFLNELIPDGYYFGPQPDSGGDWGFYRQDAIEQDGLFEDAVYQYQNNLQNQSSQTRP